MFCNIMSLDLLSGDLTLRDLGLKAPRRFSAIAKNLRMCVCGGACVRACVPPPQDI